LRLEPAELKQIAGNQQPRKNKFAGKHNMARVAREANGMPEHAITARLEAMAPASVAGKSTEGIILQVTGVVATFETHRALFGHVARILRRLRYIETPYPKGVWNKVQQ
jgi:hypothetical protein